MNPSNRRWLAAPLALVSAWALSAPAEERRAPAQPPSDTRVARRGVAGTAMRKLPLRIEGESLVGSAYASAGPITAQGMISFGADWSGGAQLFWQPPDPVDTPIRNWPHLTFYVDVATDGSYALAIRHTRAPDYGDVRIFVRGQPVADLSGYAAGVEAARVEVGLVGLKAGKNQVVLTVFRRPASSQSSYVGLDALELTLEP
jgi:hypothetical protein